MKAMFDAEPFALPEEIDSDRTVVATYLLRSPEKHILALVASMAVEQTTGTWVKVPGETNLRVDIKGKSLGSGRSGRRDGKTRHRPERTMFQIAYPVENIGCQIPMLLTTVLGISP
jgi:2,3-diketo-5-methylthiopentyl-1-phosphate enolase